MSFESKMKKHIQQVFDENVSPVSPYKNIETPSIETKKRFPWFKILLPIGASAAACAILVAVSFTLVSSGMGGLAPANKADNSPTSHEDPINGENGSSSDPKFPVDEDLSEDASLIESIRNVCAPKHNGVTTLNSTFVSNTAVKALQDLDSIFKDTNNKNLVISPASYLLSVSGIGAVSEGFDYNAFGLTDDNDIKTLLEAWNYIDKEVDSVSGAETTKSSMDSGILHQQVGSKFAFDEQKRTDVESKYIATSVASSNNYNLKAQEYFNNTVGVNATIPNLNLTKSSIITYSALKLFDKSVPYKTGKDYFVSNGQYKVYDAAMFGDSQAPIKVKYYETLRYQMFELDGIVIVLPNTDLALEDISISEAYSAFITNNVETYAYGYVPYFHLKSSGFDLTNLIKDKTDTTTMLYSELLKEPVKPNKVEMRVIQSSEFGFVKPEEEPVENVPVLNADPVINLRVDRPFYAICVDKNNNFPMFVNKVNLPSK